MHQVDQRIQIIDPRHQRNEQRHISEIRGNFHHRYGQKGADSNEKTEPSPFEFICLWCSGLPHSCFNVSTPAAEASIGLHSSGVSRPLLFGLEPEQGATSSYIFLLSDTLWLKPRPQPTHLASYWAWLKRSLLQEAHVHCGKKQECARHSYKSAEKWVCKTVFRHVPNYDPH